MSDKEILEKIERNRERIDVILGKDINPVDKSILINILAKDNEKLIANLSNNI